MTNETYQIIIESPLLRPGMSVSTSVSSKYLVRVMTGLLDMVREFNAGQETKVVK